MNNVPTGGNAMGVEYTIIDDMGRVREIWNKVCPVCSEPITMNLRSDDLFVQDEGWDKAAERYSAFLSRHQDLNVLFLELAVGFNTPVIIKVPFIQMTERWKNATYACLNYSEAYTTKQILNRSICIDGDIGEILKKLR